MRGRWLTPDGLPDTMRCWAVLIPDSVDFLALLKGAVDELRFSVNYEQFGSLTPDETAQAFAGAFDTFLDLGGSCRMIGAIIAYATSDPPANTLACDGSSYDRVDYPALYATLDDAFILDADTFAVPDLRGRTIIGIGTGSGLSTRNMGDSVGAERVTLDVSEIPGHTHTDGIAVTTLINGGVEAPASSAIPSVSVTGSTGGGASHDNMTPSFALGYAIIAR